MERRVSWEGDLDFLRRFEWYESVFKYWELDTDDEIVFLGDKWESL